MLSKKQRLPIQEFITKRAETKRNPFFTVKTFATGLPYSRFGVVISKKTVAKATGRNKLKRLIFEYCAALTAPPRDVLIIVQKGAIMEELKKLL